MMRDKIFDEKTKYDTRQAFKLSTEEKSRLIKEANKRGLNISSFIRLCVNKFIEGGN